MCDDYDHFEPHDCYPEGLADGADAGYSDGFADGKRKFSGGLRKLGEAHHRANHSANMYAADWRRCHDDTCTAIQNLLEGRILV